jgi:ADP-ribose pyrophosphatase
VSKPPADPSSGGDFEIVGSEAVAEIGFLTVESVEMRGPDGSVSSRIAVRHPGAVAVLPLDGEDVVLIRQYRAPVDQLLLEIPAGKLDVADEPAEETAVRELEEEIGMRAGRMQHLFGFLTTPGFSDERIDLFLATDLTPVPHAPHGPEEEAAEIVRCPVSDVASLLADGRVTDVKTIIALQWLLLSR